MNLMSFTTLIDIKISIDAPPSHNFAEVVPRQWYDTFISLGNK